MRIVPSWMTTVWKSGDFTGPNRPKARVTIQRTSMIVRQYGNRERYASYMFGNDNPVVELPNVKSVQWSRSVETDAGTCQITLWNAMPLALGTKPDASDKLVDQPGFYTFNRGTEVPNPWNHVINSFHNKIHPDQLIRTYEGFGITPSVSPDDDPRQLPSGVWLIDDVTLSTDGSIQLNCRDATRLLLDQIAFPPVIPFGIYPLTFNTFHKVDRKKIPVKSTSNSTGYVRPSYTSDSGIPYNGRNGSIFGHRPTDAMDSSNPDASYWLSIGNDSPRADYSFEFVEGDFTKSMVSGVRVHVKGGPYRMYISVYADKDNDGNFNWQGHSTIPYNRHDPVSAPNGADIKFIKHVQIDENEDLQVGFTGVKNAKKVRITFHHLWDSGQGTFPYRAAVRDFQVLCGETSTKTKYTAANPATKWKGDYGDYCADDQTEILTRRGWLKWDEVQEGDETLAINPATGLSEWTIIESIFREHRQREMFSMESAVHSSLTTPDHKWLVTDHAGRLTWRTTETLKSGQKIPLTAVRGDHPVEAKYIDALVELAAWFWTEGWLSRQGNCVNACIAQSRRVNPEHCDRIEAALRAIVGNPYQRRGREGSWSLKERVDGVVSYYLGQELTKLLLEIAPDKIPTPEFLTSLTQAQLDLFIQTSIDADGWRKGQQQFLSQADEGRIRSFEMACALAGIGTSVNKNGKTWTLTLLVQRQFWPQRTRIIKVDYDGIIWCPTLAYHNWLARRNGKVYFTGNTDVVKFLLAYGGFYWPYWPHNNYLMNTAGVKTHLQPTGEWVDPSNGHIHTGTKGDPVLYGQKPDTTLANIQAGVAIGAVWGDLEQSGTYGDVELTPDIFDKQPLMDGIAYVRDMLGFIFYVDETGAAIFRSGNVWKLGNYLVDPSSPLGARTVSRVGPSSTPNWCVTIHEKQTLLGLQAGLTSREVRERIVVANAGGDFGAVTKGIKPYDLPSAGLRRVAVWSDQHFKDDDECQVMADLISVRALFMYRTDRITVTGYPAIQVDDQIKLVEGFTEENGDIHYVKGITSTLSHDTGEWQYEIDTHWLGDQPFGRWAFDPGLLDPKTQAYLHALGRVN